jgi:hypothetical protein
VTAPPATAATPALPCREAPIPTALRELTWDQALGRACCICRRPLTRSVPRGWIRARDGAHVLDTEVWSCP